jgi:hypothetical protein
VTVPAGQKSGAIAASKPGYLPARGTTSS